MIDPYGNHRTADPNWTKKQAEQRRREIEQLRSHRHYCEVGPDLEYRAMNSHELLASPDCARRDVELEWRAMQRQKFNQIEMACARLGHTKAQEQKAAAYTLSPHWFPTFRRWFRWLFCR